MRKLLFTLFLSSVSILNFAQKHKGPINWLSLEEANSLYKENPKPQTHTKRIIKTGIFAYCRNPMYMAFILFHLSMFLIFENVAYFLSSLGLFFWINNFVIPKEEKYLIETFGDEYDRYLIAVKKWMFF